MSEYIGYIGTDSEIVGEITTASIEGSMSAGTVILNEYVLTISDITGGHRLTITKGATTQTMDVMDGESPSAYLKNASVSGETLTLTKQDDTVVTYSGGSEAFIVTFTLAAGAQIPTCDRTYAEIVAAETANKTIIGKLVSSGATDPTVFAYMGRLGSSSDAELAFMHLRYALVTMITMGFDSSIGMSSQEFPQRSIVESHMNNAEVHTSAAEKETWNGKQNAITGSTDLTANSLAADALKDKSGDHLLAELINDEWYLGDSSAPINATDAQAFYVPQVDASGANDQAATKQYVDEQAAAKQDTISDLATIRSGAAAGATAYQKPAGGIPDADIASAATWNGKQDALAAYLKNASVSGETLTLTKQDDSTVTYGGETLIAEQTVTQVQRYNITAIDYETGLVTLDNVEGIPDAYYSWTEHKNDCFAMHLKDNRAYKPNELVPELYARLTNRLQLRLVSGNQVEVAFGDSNTPTVVTFTESSTAVIDAIYFEKVDKTDTGSFTMSGLSGYDLDKITIRALLTSVSNCSFNLGNIGIYDSSKLLRGTSPSYINLNNSNRRPQVTDSYGLFSGRDFLGWPYKQCMYAPAFLEVTFKNLFGTVYLVHCRCQLAQANDVNSYAEYTTLDATNLIFETADTFEIGNGASNGVLGRRACSGSWVRVYRKN